jgi:hypothetical protein
VKDRVSEISLSCTFAGVLNNWAQVVSLCPINQLECYSLLIETLLFGDDSLSEEQNAQIFKSVQLNIKQTKGFIPQ